MSDRCNNCGGEQNAQPAEPPAQAPAEDAETVRRMLDAYRTHAHKAREIDGMAAALAVAREGMVPASALGPVTDEEWERFAAAWKPGGGGIIRAMARVGVDNLLTARFAPTTAKADPAVEAVKGIRLKSINQYPNPGGWAINNDDDGANIVAAVDKARAAEKEAANGRVDG
jgi:hypothetical protein